MNATTAKTLFSSDRMDWATPRWLARQMVEEFSIETDVCASAENTVVPQFIEESDDALTQPWTGRCWMNPPYGRDIGKWVRKAATSVVPGDSESIIVCLLPSRTDTKWWHHDVMRHASEVRFIRGRLTFEGAPGPAPFPSAIVVFDGPYDGLHAPKYSSMDGTP